MPQISDTTLLFYIVLLILLGGVYFISYLFHYAVEESSVINFRLRVTLLCLFTLGLPFYCFIFFDGWYYQTISFFSLDYQFDWLHYVGVLILLSGTTIYRFFRYADFEDLIFLGLISVFILRALFDQAFVNHVYAWIYFAFVMYYGVFIIRNVFTRISDSIFWGVVLSLGFWGFSFFVLDYFRTNQFYAAYIAIIFVTTLWMRYLWILEYKRRKRCPNCGGWGKLGIKGKKRFWWAIGFKESSSSKSCEACQGKGWMHKYPVLLHGEAKKAST